MVFTPNTDHVMHIKPGIISFLFVADRRGTRCGLLLKSSFWCSGWTSAAHLHHVHMHGYTECLTRDWLIKIFALLSTWTGVPAECTLWKWKFAVGIHHYSVRPTLHFHFNDVTFFKSQDEKFATFYKLLQWNWTAVHTRRAILKPRVLGSWPLLHLNLYLKQSAWVRGQGHLLKNILNMSGSAGRTGQTRNLAGPLGGA